MIKQSVKMAWKSITSNKMRSFLTMLGIIIGVMSLVVLVSIVNSATSSVNDQISSMGSNLLTVTVRDDKGNPMKISDVSAFADRKEIEETAPVAQNSGTVSSTYTEETANLYGTTGAYFSIQQKELYEGRFLKKSDIDNHTNVAVINAGAATEIMGRMNVTGETISIDGMKFQIVGVLAAKDSDSTTTETYEVYIPYTSMIRMFDSESSNVTSFCASASSEETLDEAEQVLEEEMMKRFSQDDDAFTIINQSTIMEARESINQTLTMMLGGIAAISLLVGGIGIMNIMMVSVTERTREIGIRKAIGASRGAIMLQFLVEALMLSLFGCVVGIILSWIALLVITKVGDGETIYRLSVGVVWLATAFSMVIGVVFGLYPANQAARKKPIDALRYTG